MTDALTSTPLDVPLWIDLAAVAVGSLQGAVFAADRAEEHQFDFVGVAAIATVMGLGGGIIRDVLLNLPPVAFANNQYLLTVLIAGCLGALFARIVQRVDVVVIMLDAAVLGLFAVVGTQKAALLALGILPAIFIGTLASTGGGIIRDLLVGRPPELLQRGSLYGLAAVAASIVFLACNLNGVPDSVATVVAVAVAFSLRMLSWWRGWQTPSAQVLIVDPKQLDPRRIDARSLDPRRRRRHRDASIAEASTDEPDDRRG